MDGHSQRIDELRTLIVHHDERYHEADAPEIPDADFDALVEAEMRKRTSGTEPGIAPPPPRGADPAFDAMVEAEMVRQRGFAESYAARNRDLFDRDRAADDARIRAAVERASDRRAYDAPSSEPPPQPQKPFAPLGAAPEPFKPTGDPRRDAKLAYAAALREQMAAPKSSLRRSWGYGALPDDDALRSPPREKAPPRDDVQAPGPLGGAYALRDVDLLLDAHWSLPLSSLQGAVPHRLVFYYWDPGKMGRYALSPPPPPLPTPLHFSPPPPPSGHQW